MAEEVEKRRPGRPRKRVDDPATMPKKRSVGRPRKVDKEKERELARKEALKENRKTEYVTVNELMEDFDLSELPPIYKCSKCGKITSTPQGRFYMVTTLAALDGNDHYCNICIDCTKRYFEDFTARYRDEKIGLLLTCAFTGHYFCEFLYEQMTAKGDSFNIGAYFRALNGVQYKNKNFITFLLETKDSGKMLSTQTEVRNYTEGKWKAADRRNQYYCIKTLGYDCFEDETYLEDDRKYLFNTLAGYLTDDVVGDPHKINCVIGIVKNLWQRDKITSKINQMLSNSLIDSQEVQRLNNAKTALESSINTTAKANGISMEGSGKKSASSGTLTGMMKEMVSNGFADIKVNVADALMDAAYQRVSEQSARALVAELNFTSDEYAKMLGEQNELVRTQRLKLVAQEEENRKLRVELDQLQKKYGLANAKKVESVDEEAELEFLEGDELGEVT